MSRRTAAAIRLGAAASIVALAACSGGHSSVVPAGRSARTMSSIAFTMHWPSALSASRRIPVGRRRPLYISPSTLSVVVEVNGDPTLTTTANKPASGTVSTVAVNAPVGADSITITTWDQANGTGNILGQITVTQTVVAGQLNTVNATVDGVMEKVGLSAAPSAFLHLGTDATGHQTATLVGTVAQTFTIVPEDVDGNVIVPPGDAPSLTMNSNDASIAVTAVSGQTDQYTVQAAYPTPAGVHAALKVAGIDGIGNTLAAQFAVNESAAIYVGYTGSGGTTVVVYDQAGTVISTSGGFAGLLDASGITYDTKRNRLIVADDALGTLAAYDMQGNVDGSFAKPTLTDPTGVVYDPDLDRLYVAQPSQSNVVALGGDGSPVSLAANAFTGMAQPASVTYNPNLYGFSPGPEVLVADVNTAAGTQVAAFNPDGTPAAGSMQYASSTDTFASIAVTYDSWVDKVFVVGDEYGPSGPVATLRQFDPNYGNIPMITATAGLNQPSNIAFNPVSLELYVTNLGDGSISVYQDSTVTSTFNQDTSVAFTPPHGLSKPKGLAIVF